MAKKKKSKIQPFVIKFIVITLIVAGISCVAGLGIIHYFRNTDYFTVRSVVIDPSLQFINKRDLRSLMGKNIFEVDLNAVQRRLSYRYPQASKLKVIKHFPNQIAVLAKPRLPFAEIQIKDKIVILDEESVVLSIEEKKKDDSLPLIVGFNWTDYKLVRGLPYGGKNIRIALEIVKYFQMNNSLSAHSIIEVNIENLSKIHFTLSNDLQVLLDRSRIAQKIMILGVVLAQDTLDLKDVKYIDLRFKEPIIGKK